MASTDKADSCKQLQHQSLGSMQQTDHKCSQKLIPLINSMNGQSVKKQIGNFYTSTFKIFVRY